MHDEMNLPTVSVILVNYNGKRFLDDCLESLACLHYPQDRLEVIMVDNGSTDGSIAYVRQRYPQTRIVLNDQNNYCRANNRGVAAAKGDYIALINNDVKVHPDWLIRLVECIVSDERIGAVGSKILFPDGRIQSVGHQEFTGFRWGDRGFREEDTGQYDLVRAVPSICGCAVLYRRSCLEQAGGFDEDFEMYLEDVDMSLRCRAAGWTLMMCPASRLIHYFHGSIGGEEYARLRQERNRLLLVAKHWPDKLSEAVSAGAELDDFLNAMHKLYRVHGPEVWERHVAALHAGLMKMHRQSMDAGVQRVFRAEQETAVLRKNLLDFSAQHEKCCQENAVLGAQVREREERIAGLANEIQRQADALKRAGEELVLLSETLKAAQERENVLLRVQAALERQVQDSGAALEESRRASEAVSLLLDEARCDAESARRDAESARRDAASFSVKAGELDAIRSSTGFKYVLRPLWTVLWELKRISAWLRRCHVLMRFYYANNPLSKAVRALRCMNDPWVRAFKGHVLNGHYAPPPDRITLMVNTSCNLRCRFCDLWKETRQMSFDEAARAIDNVSRVKPHWLVITGGEPFLHPDLFRIVERAHNRSMKVSITTNGTLIEERFDELKKAGVDVVSISLDGQDAAHDFLRGRDGTAERVRRGIIKLHEAGQTLSVNYVVTNRNVEDLPAVYAWVSSLGIPFDFWPVNYDRTLGRLNGEQVRMYEAFARMLKNKGVISRAAYEYHMNARFYVREETVLRVRCLGLSRSFGVLVNGDILPCCVWGREYRGLGNVFKDEMDVLWHSQPFFEARQRLYAHGCSAGCYNSCLHEFSAVTGERCLLAAGPRKAQR